MNENPKPTPEIYWEVRIAPNTYPPEEAGYFHARYRKEWPTTTGRDYEILLEKGSGVYLGQVMTVEPMRPELKRWWEGDLKIFIDGRLGAAFQGTGHEDEYLGGWSNEWLMNPYSLPMHGEPKTAELRQVDFQWSAATTVYRFFMGGVPFQNGIEVLTEHGNESTANALYSSVAYFYAGPEPMERLGVAEGDGSRLRFDVPSGYRHLRLRRRYDRTAIQEAEVWIDGRGAGVWYDASVSPDEKAVESDFLLPEVSASSERQLEIEIRPLRPGWNASRYELWGMK